MPEAVIVNYIDIGDDTFLFDSLTEEKLNRVRELMQERLMEPIGFKRNTA